MHVHKDSKSEKQQFLARTLIHEPGVVILDPDPAMGDPKNVSPFTLVLLGSQDQTLFNCQVLRSKASFNFKTIKPRIKILIHKRYF